MRARICFSKRLRTKPPAGSFIPKTRKLLTTVGIVGLLFAVATGTKAQSGPEVYGAVRNRTSVSVPTETGGEAALGTATVVRLIGEFEPHESLTFHTEVSWRSLTGALAAGYHADRVGATAEVAVESLEIDHAWGRAAAGPVDLQIGKLPIAWGTGYVFNPTARTVPASSLGEVTEETPGVLGAIGTLFLGRGATLSGYIAFQDRSHSASFTPGSEARENLPVGARATILAGPFDVSLGGIREVLRIPQGFPGAGWNRRWWGTADFVGNLAAVNLYGEAALLLSDAAGAWSVGVDSWTLDDSLEATFGLWYLMPDPVAVDLRVEYIHQGTGESDKDDYSIVPLLSGERALRGEDYLFASAERVFADFHTVGLAGVVNLNDGSVALLPEYAWEVYADFTVTLGAELPFGEEGTEFDGRLINLAGAEVDLLEPTIVLEAKLSF